MDPATISLALTGAIKAIELFRTLQANAQRTRALNDAEVEENERQLAEAMASDRWKTDAELGVLGQPPRH
jgi:hypothetical protein